MHEIYEELQSIIAYTELHLLRESPSNGWLLTDPTTHKVYKNFAKQKQKKAHASPKQPNFAQPTSPDSKGSGSVKITAVNSIDKQKQKKIRQRNNEQPLFLPPSQVSTAKKTPSALSEDEFRDLRLLMNKHFPAEKLINPNSEEFALSTAEAIIFVSDPTPKQHRVFLQNIAKAIQVCLCPALLVTEQKNFPRKKLKLLIGEESALKQLPFDNKGCMLPLSPIDEYLQEPAKKAKLWSNIRERLLHAKTPIEVAR